MRQEKNIYKQKTSEIENPEKKEAWGMCLTTVFRRMTVADSSLFFNVDRIGNEFKLQPKEFKLD